MSVWERALFLFLAGINAFNAATLISAYGWESGWAMLAIFSLVIAGGTTCKAVEPSTNKEK